MNDNYFKTTKRLVVIWGSISMIVSLLVLLFIGWVIVKTMTYFGII